MKIFPGIAGIAAVVFWFMPLGTATQVLLCVGSLAIAAIFWGLSNRLDDENTGYWPIKPRQ
jgi:hypothetical protein